MIQKDLSRRKIRVIIVGAGTAGRKVVQQIRKEGRSDILVIGFVDDDKNKITHDIDGVRVLGMIRDIPRLIKQHRVDQIIISIPSIGKGVAQRVIDIAPPGFPIKVLPSIASIILGEVQFSNVRDLDLSDLIGRPLVKSSQRSIYRNVRGGTFLVTGGAGSIGSEIVRQLHDSKAARIVVVDSWEEGIYHLLEEFGSVQKKGYPQMHFLIGNIRDKKRLEEIFQMFSYDAVLHAAAYKHIHLTEANPTEARKTNYEGTKNLLALTVKYHVKDFLFISTDKAVHPVSVLGKTKRAAELLVKKYAKTYKNGRFFSVRFGNVLNSSGSVVPKFLRQIREEKRVTITDRNATRFFMSIPEAVSLVLQSWIVAKNGEILVLDMGEPVRIFDLALNLIKMHGLAPHHDVTIEETGLRPGEKIHEELFYDKNKVRPSKADRIFIAE